MAKENGLLFLETSAKTAYNVIESFNLSAQSILNNIEKNGGDSTINSNIKINKDIGGNPGGIVGPNQKENGCC